MELPQVNNNGTSREELVQQRLAAREAVQAAMAAMNAAAPNARDFQTTDSPATRYHAARSVYHDRFAFLDKLANELFDEALAIQDQ